MIINKKFIFGVIVMFSSVCVASERTMPIRRLTIGDATLTSQSEAMAGKDRRPQEETLRPAPRYIEMMHGWRE